MHPSACQVCNGESLHEHPDMDDLIETAIANIDALEKEMERWIVIGETHQALAISNQMVTTDIANLLGSSLVQGFWQPVAFGTKTESCFDTARVGALHVRLDEIEDTLVNTGILLRKTKRAKQEANMEARHMLLGRAAGPSGASLMIPFLNGGSPGASTSGSLNTARYPPSLPPPPHASSNASSEPLVLPGVVSSLDPGTMHSERSTKRLATLSKSALSSLVPLLRMISACADSEFVGDVTAYSTAVYELARHLLWSSCVCTTEVRTITTSNALDARIQLEVMDYKLAGFKTLLLLDYHLLDQAYHFEYDDGGVCIGHVTFGMESGTLVDQDSARGCYNTALE